MDAGQLDRHVTFQEAVIIRGPDGMLIQGWEDRFTLWVSIGIQTCPPIGAQK